MGKQVSTVTAGYPPGSARPPGEGGRGEGFVTKAERDEYGQAIEGLRGRRPAKSFGIRFAPAQRSSSSFIREAGARLLSPVAFMSIFPNLVGRR